MAASWLPERSSVVSAASPPSAGGMAARRLPERSSAVSAASPPSAGGMAARRLPERSSVVSAAISPSAGGMAVRRLPERFSDVSAASRRTPGGIVPERRRSARSSAVTRGGEPVIVTPSQFSPGRRSFQLSAPDPASASRISSSAARSPARLSAGGGGAVGVAVAVAVGVATGEGVDGSAAGGCAPPQATAVPSSRAASTVRRSAPAFMAASPWPRSRRGPR